MACHPRVSFQWNALVERGVVHHHFDDGKFARHVDFGKMTQTNTVTGMIRRLEKKQVLWKFGFPEPSVAEYWDMGNIKWNQSDIASLQVLKMYPELSRLVLNFGLGLGVKFRLLGISRSFNQRSFEMFRAQLQTFSNKSVTLLWHGCSEANPDLIQKHGLTISYVGPRNRWGTGHYFSNSAGVSHRGYTGSKSKRTLFLALVALGNILEVDASQDYKQAMGPICVGEELCDSVIGKDVYDQTACIALTTN